MELFISLNLITILGGIIARWNKRYDKKELDRLFLIIIFSLLTAVNVLRDTSVGADTYSYVQIFSELRELPWSSLNSYHCLDNWGMEIGFCILMKFTGLFTSDIHLYFLASGVLIFSSVAYFIYKNSSNVYVSTCIFISIFYVETFNMTRQYLALSFLLYAYYLLKESKVIKSLILFGIALLFHTTAIIFLLVYVLYYIKPGKNTVLLSIIGSVGILMVYNSIIQLAFILFPRYRFYLFSHSVYLMPQTGHGMTQLINIIIILGCFLIACLLRLKKRIKEDREIYLSLCMVVFATCIGIITLRVDIIHRLYAYYYIFLVLLVPNLLERLKKYKYLCYIPFLAGMNILFVVLLVGSKNNVLPYHFWSVLQL